MTLAAQIETDISTVFLNTDDFAVSITYYRGVPSVALTALVDSSVFEVAEGLGFTRVETRDYLIKASELILGSVPVTPERGDKIIEGGRTYLVTQPSGQPAFAYEDENQLLLRVHTVLTKAA